MSRPANRRELQGFLNQGKAIRAIAFYYKTSESTIRRKVKQFRLKVPKHPVPTKHVKLPRKAWIPARMIGERLESEFRFINIQHPPYSWYNQKTLVFSNRRRNPPGLFDNLAIYYVAEVSAVYFLFVTTIRLPSAPLDFKEAFAFAQANAMSILEQRTERSSILPRRVVGFAFSAKGKHKRVVKVR